MKIFNNKKSQTLDKETAIVLIILVFLLLILLFVAGGPFYRLLRGSAEKYERCENTQLYTAEVIASCEGVVLGTQCDECSKAVDASGAEIFCCKKINQRK